jgi:hypothetical protein
VLVSSIIASSVLVVSVLGQAGGQGASRPASGPETFQVTATASGRAAAGSLTAPMTIRIDRYTSEHARTAMTDALKYRGYPGFLAALRDSPVVGSIDVAGQKFPIRWARQEPNGAGRTITIVTDKPVYFVGLGKPGAKSTSGYEVAVAKLDLDASGGGNGIMAAAARVKPRDVTDVQIDDYAEAPLQLSVAPSAPR